MATTPTHRPPAAQPKPRPINLRPWEVRAFLDGTKTQLRRPVDFTRAKSLGEPFDCDATGYTTVTDTGLELVPWTPDLLRIIDCPFGRPGNRVYGREPWRPKSWSADGGWGEIEYRTDGHIRQVYGPWEFGHAYPEGRYPKKRDPKSWRNVTHLPFWATRLHFTLSATRIEPVQAISEADALAEGIRILNGRYTFNGGLHESCDPVASYAAAWDSMFGDGAWERDEMVWCLTLERIAI